MSTLLIDSEAQVIEEKLKVALWYHIGRLVDDETLKLGINATPQFIGSLAEFVWAQIATTATDLEAFAKHAGRSTIKTDDILLLGRRNEGLESILKDCAQDIAKRDQKSAARHTR